MYYAITLRLAFLAGLSRGLIVCANQILLITIVYTYGVMHLREIPLKQQQKEPTFVRLYWKHR